MPNASPNSFTSFLTPSSSSSSGFGSGRGRYKNFTGNGRARGMPIKHLLDY